MRYIAGIDIGNSSTEVALATLDEAGALTITHSALAETTGLKGTLRNVFGIQEALALVAKRAGIGVGDISLIRINEATPVIGDVAMETITETIITESTMIGHNPKTPGGVGLGVGITITPQELLTRPAEAPYILVVSSAFDFADIANVINASLRAGYQITGVILQRVRRRPTRGNPRRCGSRLSRRARRNAPSCLRPSSGAARVISRCGMVVIKPPAW